MSNQTPEVFYAKCTRTNSGCLIWGGWVSNSGYGQTSYGGKRWLTHRLSWFYSHGEHPGKLCVLHKCDVKTCVEPTHLFLGTNADNTADMDAKGRVCHGQRHSLSRLTDSQVTEIRKLKPNMSNGQLAEMFGVNKGTISYIIRRITWKRVA